MAFEWNTGERPPEIEAHSRAKLDVLRKYISYYFDTLSSNFLRDEFNLDLVDGFSGGGVFRGSNGETIPGTPLIMLEEIEAAKVRLNERRSKPLEINCSMSCWNWQRLTRFVSQMRTGVDGLVA